MRALKSLLYLSVGAWRQNRVIGPSSLGSTPWAYFSPNNGSSRRSAQRSRMSVASPMDMRSEAAAPRAKAISEASATSRGETPIVSR
jgi:hypothetical protein